MNWGQKDLAERLEIGTSTVGMWCLGKSTPSYAVIEKLFRLGITPRELFGEEIDEIIKKCYHSVDYAKMHFAKSSFPSEFLEGLDGSNDPESALNALVERKILEMKANGKI